MQKKSNPERTHIVKTYLNDAEKTLLDVKFSHSGKHSIAAFLRAPRTYYRGKSIRHGLFFHARIQHKTR